MPIRKSEKARYPADWKAISAAVRADAGNECEQCGAPNGETVFRSQNEDYGFKAVYAVVPAESVGAHVFSAEDGECLAVRLVDDLIREQWKPARIILTVAHLDHQPENCARTNLRAWCQRCHLRYDAKHHAANSSATRRGRKASGDLFARVTAQEKGGG